MKILQVCILVALSTTSSYALTYTEQTQVVNRAQMEAFNRVLYDASYHKIKYPGGDVSYSRGACVEVVIRALRAIGLDLQKEIHEDKKSCPKAYPKGKLDSNLDHRRCCNQIVWMKRHAKSLSVKTDAKHLPEWQPGDIVYWDLDGKGLLHTGVISNAQEMNGTPFVIHNIGPYATESPDLAQWKIIYHFRVKVPVTKPAAKRALF